MRDELFVFSGTGNSLALALALSESLGGCPVRSMTTCIARGELEARADAVGFVFPLYFAGLPRAVLEFVRAVDLDRSSYVYAVVTRGGGPGAAIRFLESELRKKSKSLDAGFYVKFWTNFAPRYPMPSERRRGLLARRALRRLERRIPVVRGRNEMVRREPLVFVPLARIVSNRFLASVRGSDERLHADERCISCGLCERLCPVGNIEMKGDPARPTWLHRCEQCLACLHFCPVFAIQYGAATKGKRRCHHPEISAEDLVRLKERGEIRAGE